MIESHRKVSHQINLKYTSFLAVTFKRHCRVFPTYRIVLEVDVLIREFGHIIVKGSPPVTHRLTHNKAAIRSFDQVTFLLRQWNFKGIYSKSRVELKNFKTKLKKSYYMLLFYLKLLGTHSSQYRNRRLEKCCRIFDVKLFYKTPVFLCLVLHVLQIVINVIR